MPSICLKCNKEFSSKKAYENHTAAKHSKDASEAQNQNNLTKLKAPVDSDGYWIVAADFRGRKSFGAYRCECGKVWTSAHSQLMYMQGCKKCNKERRPDVMWVNIGEKQASIDRDEDKPHDSRRCQACRAGDCRKER